MWQIISVLGSLFLLAAYLLFTIKKIDGHSVAYYGMNAAGCLFIGGSLLMSGFNLGSFILQVVFFVISIFGTIKYHSNQVTEKVEEVAKLPHEIFPELLYWEKGDKVTNYRRTYCRGEFLGILGGKVCISFPDITEVSKLSAEEVAGKHWSSKEINYVADYCNKDAQERMSIATKQQAQFEIAQDSYNEFLESFREVNHKMLSEWQERQKLPA